MAELVQRIATFGWRSCQTPMWRGSTPTAIESTVAISSSPSSSARAERAPCLPRSKRAHGEARLGQQRAAGRGERHAARQAVEDRAVQLLLERLDVLRERRLGHPDAAARRA